MQQERREGEEGDRTQHLITKSKIQMAAKFATSLKCLLKQSVLLLLVVCKKQFLGEVSKPPVTEIVREGGGGYPPFPLTFFR